MHKEGMGSRIYSLFAKISSIPILKASTMQPRQFLFYGIDIANQEKIISYILRVGFFFTATI
jgi:hypothetical protein